MTHLPTCPRVAQLAAARTRQLLIIGGAAATALLAFLFVGMAGVVLWYVTRPSDNSGQLANTQVAGAKKKKTPAVKAPAIVGVAAKVQKAEEERQRKAEKEAETARKAIEAAKVETARKAEEAAAKAAAAKAEAKRNAEEDAKRVIEAANSKLSRENYNKIRANSEDGRFSGSSLDDVTKLLGPSKSEARNSKYLIVTWRSTPTQGEPPTIITVRFRQLDSGTCCDGVKSFKGP